MGVTREGVCRLFEFRDDYYATQGLLLVYCAKTWKVLVRRLDILLEQERVLYTSMMTLFRRR